MVKNTSVFLTGASGFLGQAIQSMMTNVSMQTLSRASDKSTYDLVNNVPKIPTVDLVVHAAGKAHTVPTTFIEKQAFFDVNVTGTKNLLIGIERASNLPKSIVFISSVAVYGVDQGTNITEDYPLNAKDPYGLSKIQAEILVREWCQKHNVVCGILRLPLLVGENPPGNLGAMIRAIKKGYYFNIGHGRAKKSMVLATDVAKIIIKVAEVGGTYNLTDGCHPNFKELSTVISKKLGKPIPKNLPPNLINIIAKIGDLIGGSAPLNSAKVSKITATLIFDDSRAVRELNWKPTPVLEFYNKMIL